MFRQDPKKAKEKNGPSLKETEVKKPSPTLKEVEEKLSQLELSTVAAASTTAIEPVEKKKSLLLGRGFNVFLFWSLVLFSVLFSHAPFLQWLLMPVNQFVVMVHEMSHAFVTVLTGGSVNFMTIVSDGAGHGGLTSSRGGLTFLSAQAGYIGETLFGCLLIYLGQFPHWSRRLLYLMGGIILLGTLLFILPGLLHLQQFFAVIGSLAWALVLAFAFFYAGRKLNDVMANILVLFLAVQCTLNSLSLIWILLPHSLGMTGGGFTDATILAKATFIPAFFWAFSWMVFSILALFFTLKKTYGAFLFGGLGGKAASDKNATAYVKPKKN